MTRPRPARWLPAAALAVVALIGFTAPAAAAPSLDRYVALGDSYTAGPFIPVQSGRPPGCQRSDHNYPSLVARSRSGTSLTDVSCSGATTADLTNPQVVPLGVNPPQFDALGPDTGLVTMGIGGNDIGFGSIIQECVTRSPRQPAGAACRDFFTAGGTDQLAARIDAAAPKIAAALAGIAERSPDARRLLVGYPAILPNQGPGCFPLIPFSPGDVAYLRATEKRLNAMLAEQAERAGAEFVDTYTPTIGHDICQPPGRKWIEGLVPTSPAAPFHPNALGMAAMARAVLGELSAPAVQPAA